MLKRKRRLQFSVLHTVLAGDAMSLLRLGAVVVRQCVPVLAVFLGSTLTIVGHAEDTSRFYTVIDESGHMRTVERTQQPKNTVPSPDTSSAPVDPLSTLNGVQYVDSGYLEKREFNLEGKKRFYAVPDGLGGTQVLERVPGGLNEVSVLGENAPASENRQPAVLVTLSEHYQRVPAADIAPLIGMTCLASPALKQAKILHNQPLNLWPRSDAQSTDRKKALNFLLVDLRQGFKDMSLQSFAPLGRRSDYYWPLVIFLDDKGCLIEGVNAFYQNTLPSTMLQQSGLIGTLHVPEKSRYMMLTPLVEATDLPHIKLSEIGQLRLIPLR